MTNAPSPYLRTFVCSTIWYAAIAGKMVSRHDGPLATFPTRNLAILGICWILTALLLGVVATRFERLRSWWGIGTGTVAMSFAVMATLFATSHLANRKAAYPEFKTTDAMMEYLGKEAAKWVKADRGVELDYSLESIRIMKEELGRVSKQIDGKNPPSGTFGTAMGYGAYVGEVLRRRGGGTWAADHAVAGERTYPLSMAGGATIFPVGWCWKRLTQGEDDNVFMKAMMSVETEKIRNAATTNSIEPAKVEPIQVRPVAGTTQ